MLNKPDTALVKQYIYESFPDLQGRVAIRSFTPPSFNFETPTQEARNHYEILLAAEAAEVKGDFLEQLSDAYREDAAGFIRAMSPEARSDFNDSCLTQTPALLCLSGFTEEKRLKQDVYILNQFPTGFRDEEIYNVFMADLPEKPLPVNFGRAARIFAMAHEFGHAALGNGIDNKTTVSHERQCDVLGFGCAAAILGAEEALPTIKIFTFFRELRTKIDALHDTGNVMRAALEEGFGHTVVSAREALDYGARLDMRFA